MSDLSESLKDISGSDELLAVWKGRRKSVIDSAIRIQSIPAPTFEESARAEYIVSAFKKAGLRNVTRDYVYNVYGRLPGRRRKLPPLIISGHMDTVFPAETDLSVRHERERQRVYGPGIGDNSLSIAAMIELAHFFKDHSYRPQTDIYFVATACEEGLGNLIGMRQAYSHFDGKIGAVVVLEGSCFGHVINAGLCIHRYRVEVTGPGGHSWARSESPSAIHQLMKIGSAIVERIRLPEEPRTTLNIGLINGGISINSRAPSAEMLVDLRSEDCDALRLVENDIFALVETFMTEPHLEITIEIVGERPGGHLAEDHPLVTGAVESLKMVGLDNVKPRISSTDANFLLDQRVPTVCIGITTGGDAHTEREYINTQPIPYGMSALTALVIEAAQEIKTWSVWREAKDGGSMETQE